ncbi:dynein light chain roadblock-type 1 [Cyanistes caeruleus]|uniref:Dynein light chain roadblock-type 1 n=3 Tax=Paridae TaxID=9153 RepID=A0A8C0UEE7_CYACU|nr:dynein light chain roadblock-type 1 [Cyanistes caeruleus]
MSLQRDPRPAWGRFVRVPRDLRARGGVSGAVPPHAPNASGAAPGPRRGGGGGSIMAEVEETLKRIQSQKGVQGIIVVNAEGIPIKSTIDNTTTIQYAGLMHSFIMKARSTVRDIDPQNDLTFLRIRSKKNEIMVAPDKDYFLIVIQNPTE